MSKKLGKIDRSLVDELICSQHGFPRDEVCAGPAFGVDVSVVDIGGGMSMAMTSDPLSLIPSLGLEESAWLSVHLMANDMATTGFPPKYAQFVLNLPASFSREDFRLYWNHIHRFCTDLQLSITGGHTGFIEGQNSTIAGGGTFITVAPLKELLLSSRARAGDAILVTKSCALSSAAILALSFPHTVKDKAGLEIWQNACDSFYRTSSLPDAMVAVGENRSGISAMHDVTEGGVLGAIYEMAVASGNGVKVFDEQLPVSEIQEQVCKIFGLDPRYCIGAGSMIIACNKKAVEPIITRLRAEGIPCVAVGEFCAPSEGKLLVKEDIAHPLPYYEEDPYWTAFFNALNLGWK